MSDSTTHFTRQDRDVQKDRKTRDIAAFLPILGVILLCTPLVSAFTNDVITAVIPRAVLYVFGVWFLLIGLTAYLSSRILHQDDD